MVTRIVLTGGPCAGKSTGLAVLEQRLTSLGYKVIIMSEMATTVLSSGLSKDDLGESFQKMLIEMQLDRDIVYNHYIDTYLKDKYDKIVVLYDRGIMDGMAYCNKENFISMLKACDNSTPYEIMGRYDGVFHLVTAANGAPDFYTTTNNTVRSETPQEAIIMDKRTMDCWVGHPHLRIINNDGVDFEKKITKLMEEIMMLLGEPIPLEIERKLLVKKPDLQILDAKYHIVKTRIIQTYLKSSDPNVERRVRQRGNAGDFSYYYTEKKKIANGTREERERRISIRKYSDLLAEADPERHQIIKDRYCFVYKDKYFELDMYPLWDDTAILEIELKDINDNISIPPEIKVIADVTDDDRYSNGMLSYQKQNKN